MVEMDMDRNELIEEDVESRLDAADCQAETTFLRYSHDVVFGSIREGLLHEEEG